MNLSLAAATDSLRPQPVPVRPNIHRELKAAGLRGDDLRDFAVFALGWFGNFSPEEAVACLTIWLRDEAERQEKVA